MISTRGLRCLSNAPWKYCLAASFNRKFCHHSSAVSVTYKDRYAILTMNGGENRFTFSFMQELNDKFDEILESNAFALITTGKGKFYSNGLDLDWVLKNRQDENLILDYMTTFTRLMARVLTFPLPTAAAINGHAFAAGGIMAFAHDYRVMNNEKGWICLPEVNINVRFGPGLCELMRAKVTDPRLRSELVLFGNRYTAQEALSHGFVEKECPLDEVIDGCAAAITSNNGFGKDGFAKDTLFTIKQELYREAVAELVRRPSSLYLFKLIDHKSGP